MIGDASETRSTFLESPGNLSDPIEFPDNGTDKLSDPKVRSFEK